MGVQPVVYVHAAAFVVSLLKAGMYEEAESFVEWYREEVGLEADDLEAMIEDQEEEEHPWP